LFIFATSFVKKDEYKTRWLTRWL